MTVRILLADDHDMLRQGLRMLLQLQPGMEVVGGARNGWEATRLAEELQPDVVLMDIRMPGIDGFEATKRVKQSCPRTRVLMLSMYDDRQAIQRALSAGASGYMLKYSRATDLVAAVAAVGSGATYLDPQVRS